MAGHSKFKNIMHRKGAQDKKRSKAFTKVVREIMVAAKTGNPEPELNPRLRAAIALAKDVNLPKDKIKAAIDKATSGTNTENYDEVRYEARGPSGVAIIVETLTDNKNRTASEIRSTLTKYGFTLVETGSVSYLFNKIGSFLYDSLVVDFDKLFEIAIDIGADDCIVHDDSYEVLSNVIQFAHILEELEKRIGKPANAEIIWKPTEFIEVKNEEKILRLIEILEENDDVQSVFTNHI